MSEVTLPGGVTLRAQELLNKSGGTSVTVAGAKQVAPGTADALDAAFSVAADNAGGYTVALIAALPHPRA